MLLVVGIALTVLGLLATVGPLALDLGGTDASPSDGSTDDRTDTDAGADESDTSGDGTIEDGETDGDGGGSWETIGGPISEDDQQRLGEDANPVKCLIE
ncbi:hypothetical protein [Halalkalicoccus ordinarius]|uniref:hypothetical protein n=1 Tax=Halalkalicoccus ordinarius TaxID=3116651 RepID=UPI00300F36E3